MTTAEVVALLVGRGRRKNLVGRALKLYVISQLVQANFELTTELLDEVERQCS